MSNKHFKDKYSEIFKMVERKINEWAPLNLLAIYCPDDEYEFEIQQIVSATLSANDIEELAGEINGIFVEEFRKSKGSLMIANKVLKAIQLTEWES
ncbi:DUF1871 family protein [Pseudobacillus wudalianchiensis]|uniref:DUF1871 domain-containing protein n=1 Tax=Pseudobacillus wudalianchiensis TaxID=1743143 RepID=A0A1B9B2E0_9BACI|nr:DUF1871 family protein [Bacillus wudalianchiensis]OCA90317.1 hypothetical protein A8F95_21235 [Bacillus wudalianchiensis]